MAIGEKPTKQLTTAKLLKRLLDPLDSAYTDQRILARCVDLADLHSRATDDPELADDLFELSRASFWAHLALFVWTHDEKALLIRYKPFSPIEMYARIAKFCDEKAPDGTWLHPIVAILKSRQLMLSWFVMARLDWCCIHRPHAYTFVVSEDEGKAADQVKRIETIHAYYPEWFKERAALQGSPCRSKGCVYPNLSQIRSVPQRSGRAAASYVPTMGFSDEAAHQQAFAKNWTSIKGTVGKFTQMFVVSSANPSYFQKLIDDSIDGRIGGRAYVYWSDTTHRTHYLKKPAFSAWRNKNNGVDCIEVFYPADPARRTAEWFKQAVQGMAIHEWRQEQEGDSTARGGQPIFQMLDRNVHMTAGHVQVVPLGKGFGLKIEGYNDPRTGQAIIRPVRLLRMMDHGTSNYCACLWAAVDDDLDWTVYRAYKQKGWFVPENAMAIARLSEGERYTRDCIDAPQGLPDQRGRVVDLYRAFRTLDGKLPFQNIEEIVKGPGSRQEGLDAIAGMLHSTLAVTDPVNAYWEREGYQSFMVEAFTQYSSLYLGRDVAEYLFEELEKARFDQRPGSDPEMNQPETSLDMMDDCIDSLRGGIRAASPDLVRQVQKQLERSKPQ